LHRGRLGIAALDQGIENERMKSEISEGQRDFLLTKRVRLGPKTGPSGE
jgi:hypothetical protein